MNQIANRKVAKSQLIVSGVSRIMTTVICLVAFVSACTSTRETTPVSSGRPTLLPVALPEMTGAAEPVQAQLRDRFA